MQLVYPNSGGNIDPNNKYIKDVSCDIYYDSERSCFWYEDSHGKWDKMNEKSLKRMLMIQGYAGKAGKGEAVSQADEEIYRIQMNNNIQYAGPLAGYREGFYEILGQRILVTRGPHFIEPKPGPWPLIQSLVEGLYKHADVDQTVYIYGWLQNAINSLRKGIRKPGQVLTFVGPPDCGKSFFQKRITHLLGGRVAKPYQYMTGSTPFNGHLFGAEHLMIEDEVANTHIHARMTMGGKFKEFTVNDVQNCHAKNRQALSLEPLWYVTNSLNDTGEDLLILPPITDSIADKITLLKAAPYKLPISTASTEESNLYVKSFQAEFPQFLYFILNEFVIPSHLVSNRFGIKHYHHPEILKELDGTAPEIKLMNMIDKTIFEGFSNVSGWEGTSEDLDSMLKGQNSNVRETAREVLNWPNATGVYLSRLMKKFPQRFDKKRTVDNVYIWKIFPTVKQKYALD